MTRRGFIAGATAMAAGFAMPGVVKSAAAARSTIFCNSTDEEEEMYKELFERFVTNTFPQGAELTIPYHDFRQACFTALNVDTLNFSELTSAELFNNNKILNIAGDYGAGNANSANVRVLKFPKFTYWGYYYKAVLSSLYGLEHLYLPNVTSFQNTPYGFHGFKGSLLSVHIDKPMVEVLAMPYFPGFNQTSLALDKVVFVCTDGTLAWNGTEWAGTPNS